MLLSYILQIVLTDCSNLVLLSAEVLGMANFNKNLFVGVSMTTINGIGYCF
jgi:hypothetical protein